MASGKTTLRDLPYPLETDAPDVAADVAALAEALDTRPQVGVGTLANRPTPSAPGNRYWVYGDSTPANNGVGWVDTGSSWIVAPWTSNIGEVRQWAGTADPVDVDGTVRWMVMDGRAISRTTYAVAFARLGTTFGNGDSSTTFNIPDGRGRVIIAAGQGSGLSKRAFAATGGEETHKLLGSESGLPPHTHAYNNPAAADTVTTAYATGSNNFTDTGSILDNTGANPAQDAANAHNNMPPFLVLNHIIKVL